MVCVGSACFFFQAEDGIRDLVRSRGLGDVYKRQGLEDAGPRVALADPGPSSMLLFAGELHFGFGRHRRRLKIGLRCRAAGLRRGGSLCRGGGLRRGLARSGGFHTSRSRGWRRCASRGIKLRPLDLPAGQRIPVSYTPLTPPTSAPG